MSLKILIDNLKKNYLPGDTIIGRLQCSVLASDYIEVCIKLVGEESINCTKESEDTDIKTPSTSSSGSQKAYFLEPTYAIVQSGHLNEGEHEFLFKLTLPRGIPSSFVGKYGYVKYFLEGRMYRNNHETYGDKKECKIFSPIDLNKIGNESMTPFTYSDKPENNSWIFALQRPRMQIWLDKTAFCVGEIITPMVELRNKSNFYKLKAHVNVRVKTSGVPQEQEYLVASDEEYINGDDRKAYIFALAIPDDANIPNFQMCYFFSQRAVLEIIAVPRIASKPELKVEVELILGHIPVGEENTARHPEGNNSINKPCSSSELPKIPECLTNNSFHHSEMRSSLYPIESCSTSSIESKISISDQNLSQHSAPSVSELLTPPIATVEESEAIELESLGSTQRNNSRDVDSTDVILSIEAEQNAPPATCQETLSSVKAERKKNWLLRQKQKFSRNVTVV